MATKLAVLAVSLLLPFAASIQDPQKKPELAKKEPPVPMGGIAPSASAAQIADLQKLSWISGTWVIEKDGVTTEEHWRPLQGSTLIGTSHSFDAKQSTFFEFLRIAPVRDKLAYIASPGGSRPTVFTLAKMEDGVVVFENEKHDHPQRIRYERTEKGMTATISMLDGSKAESFVFTKK